MTDDGSIRASDNDRETVVAALREAYTEGRLTLDEFDERSSAAYASKTWGALRELTTDLPSPPVLAAGTSSIGTSSTGSDSTGINGVARLGAAGQNPGQNPAAQNKDMRALPASDGQSKNPIPASPDIMRSVPRRPRPFSRLLPVVFIWALIAAAAGASQLAAVLAVVFVAVLAIRTLSGSRR